MTPRRVMRALALPLAAPLWMACERGQSATTSPTAAAVRMVGETDLVETESLYLGRPVGFAMNSAGDFFVSDDIEERVVRFSRRGELLATYGRGGSGPGEFLAVSRPLLVGDTLLLVQDIYRRHVAVFDARSGAHRYDVPVEGEVGSLRERRGRIWMGARNHRTRTGVVSWPVGTRDMRYTVAYPSEYDAYPALATLYHRVEVLPLGDSLLVSFLGSPDILITDSDGTVLHSFRVPSVRRRGIPPDLGARLLKTKSSEEQFRLSSFLFTAERLSDGNIVLVYVDQELRSRTPIRTAFVSVVTADLGKACVDIPLPLSEDGMTWVAFRGDTLVTLEQEVVESGARLVSRDYLIELAGCEWVNLQAGTTE